MVRIWRMENSELVFEDFFISDENGSTIDIALYAPSITNSLNTDHHDSPYETYHVEVRKKGYAAQRILGIQIFENIHSQLSVILKEREQNENINQPDIIIDEHTLSKNYDETIKKNETLTHVKDKKHSFTIFLKTGSQGSDVARIQNLLNFIARYYPSLYPSNTDGVFTEETKASVISFQKLLGIEEHGIIDTNTWNLINEIYDELKIQ